MTTKTNRYLHTFAAIAAAGVLSFTGCDQSSEPAGGASGTSSGSGSTPPPSFSLAWSEYPSWSVFGVAEMKGLIDGEEGKLGPIETKWNVDIVLNETDYDTCINLYANGVIDAVCITNMDILNPANGRTAVAILPTSTSFGADACIVTGIDNVEQLKGKSVYGLEASVSQYTFVRGLEAAGQDPAEYKFSNMDPAAAAQAMITSQPGYEAIVVWNPFVLETLKQRSDAKVLFDSTSLPGEIIDMVVAGKDSLDKPGGDRFAQAVIDTFYQVNQMLADPEAGDDTLLALGSKFSSLGLEKMKVVVQQTKFYKSPDEAKALFDGDQLPATMDKVSGFCKAYGIVDNTPGIAYGSATSDASTRLTFTSQYIDAVMEKGE